MAQILLFCVQDIATKMKLAELLQPLLDHPNTSNSQTTWHHGATREVAAVTSDSRAVKAGSVFVALSGDHVDGHQYVKNAIDAGATAVVVATANADSIIQLNTSIPFIVVNDTYQALALLSAQFNGWPGHALRLVGVTGTNGKTTVTHLLQQVLQHADKPVGLIGTLGSKVSAGEANGTAADGYSNTGHTTPMAPQLQTLLASMHNELSKPDHPGFVVMEVSSHALAQHRVAGCAFEVAIITNLTQDHLDFHNTMDAYADAKALLFSGLNPANTPLGKPRSAVINLDDAYAMRFLAACPTDITILTYGVKASNAVVRAEGVTYTLSGASYTAVTPQGQILVTLQLAGEFSVYNSLAALAGGLALGLPLHTIVEALQAVPGVRGRFEVVSKTPFVIVDYAHTPDGLHNILSAARQVLPVGGKLITVFGCGGDRDATKRPKMGRIAEQLSDCLVLTSDNPRSEDPQQIITDVLSGFERFTPERMTVNADREQAIQHAITLAGPNDLVVIAGKGHEDYQILADRVIHFDDREVAQHFIAQRATQPV
jgi:UDP-N-acetylmuramoyl-L-alanyl-D-glutamate--2,6-diaminopimelate ligase